MRKWCHIFSKYAVDGWFERGIFNIAIYHNKCFCLATSEVGKWLSHFDLGLYESYLLANGFDDLDFLVSFEL